VRAEVETNRECDSTEQQKRSRVESVVDVAQPLLFLVLVHLFVDRTENLSSRLDALTNQPQLFGIRRRYNQWRIQKF